MKRLYLTAVFLVAGLVVSFLWLGDILQVLAPWAPRSTAVPIGAALLGWVAIESAKWLSRPKA